MFLVVYSEKQESYSSNKTAFSNICLDEDHGSIGVTAVSFHSKIVKWR